MATNPNKNNLEKLRASDEISKNLDILYFATTAICAWNEDWIFSEDHKIGFSYIMDMVQEDLKKQVKY